MALRTATRLRRDRAFLLGLLGGVVVAAAGLVGYIAVPALAASGDPTEAVVSSGIDLLGRPLWYHGIVLVVPSCAASLAGTLLVRRWGLTGWAPVAKLAGGIVGVPFVTIVVTYVVTAVGVGVAFATTPTGSLSEGVVLFVVFTVYALIFGLLVAFVAAFVVVPGVLLGAASGYLLARGIVRVSGARSADE